MTPVRALSGGERNRLLLAKLFLKPSNLLILDEPTNDLDVETLELLEELIDGYQGSVLLVSHDRQFVDNTVTECWIFEGEGEIGRYVGGYHDAQHQRSTSRGSQRKSRPAPVVETPAVEPNKSSVAKKAPAKLSYNLTRELEQLPQKMENLEAEIAQLQSTMADASFFSRPHDETQPIIDKLATLEDEFNTAFERWEYLENLKNGE